MVMLKKYYCPFYSAGGSTLVSDSLTKKDEEETGLKSPCFTLTQGNLLMGTTTTSASWQPSKKQCFVPHRRQQQIPLSLFLTSSWPREQDFKAFMVFQHKSLFHSRGAVTCYHNICCKEMTSVLLSWRTTWERCELNLFAQQSPTL